MHKQKKRGQVTIFIIVGILLISTFGISAYFISNTIKSASEQQLDKVNRDLFQASGLEEYTKRCLEKSLQDGIKQLGLQGGYFYSSQPGSLLPKALKIERKLFNKNVTYLIINSLTTKSPEYPCFPGTKEPRFCRFYANKQKYASTGGKIDNHKFGKSALPHLYKAGTGFSIEEELQFYLINRTKYCTNFEELLSRPEFRQYKVTEGEITANITFRENDILASINYPLIFEIKGKQPIVKRLAFELDSNIKFKKIYDLSSEIINRDVDNVNFDPIKDAQVGYYLDYDNAKKKLLFSDYDFEIFVERGANDDVFTITDKSTIIAGEPFKFIFARENRPPVLDYVSLNPSSFTNNRRYDYDVYAYPGSTLTLPVASVDPDEDQLYYRFGGWKSEYYTKWDDLLGTPEKTDAQSSQTAYQFELWEVDNQVTKPYPDGTTVVYSTLSTNPFEGLTQVPEPKASNGYIIESTQSNQYLRVTFTGETIAIFPPQDNPAGASLQGQTGNAVLYLGSGQHTIDIKGGAGFALDYFVIDGKTYEAEPFVGSNAEKPAQENVIYYNYVSTDPGTGWEQVRDDMFYKKYYGSVIGRGDGIKGGGVNNGYGMANWEEKNSNAQIYFMGTGIKVYGFYHSNFKQSIWVLDRGSKNQKSGLVQVGSKPMISIEKLSNTRHVLEIQGKVGLDYYEVFDYPSPWSVSGSGQNAQASTYLSSSDKTGDVPVIVTISVSDNQFSDYQDVYVVVN